MMTTFEREISPASAAASERWIVPGAAAADFFQLLTANFETWRNYVSKNMILFKEHVHDNPDIEEIDLRQHRGRICGLISDGEQLAIAFLQYAEQHKVDVSDIMKLLDAKKAELLAELFHWHGPLESQNDVPESFKRAAVEADSATVVDLDI